MTAWVSGDTKGIRVSESGKGREKQGRKERGYVVSTLCTVWSLIVYINDYILKTTKNERKAGVFPR